MWWTTHRVCFNYLNWQTWSMTISNSYFLAVLNMHWSVVGAYSTKPSSWLKLLMSCSIMASYYSSSKPSNHWQTIIWCIVYHYTVCFNSSIKSSEAIIIIPLEHPPVISTGIMGRSRAHIFNPCSYYSLTLRYSFSVLCTWCLENLIFVGKLYKFLKFSRWIS